MAVIPVTSSPVTITATNQYALGVASDFLVGTVLIQFVGTAWTGSTLIKARKKGSGAAFQPIPYVRRFLNGAVSDDTVTSVAITGDSIIKVDASGLEIALDVTGGGTSVRVDYVLLDGAAA